jgi:hypothetical protein
MANTLTNLIPDLYSSLDVVSRELTGFIPAVTLDAVASRAALNQTVRSFVAPAAAAGNITPAATAPNDGDQTIGNVSLAITKARRVPIRWNGEEELGVLGGGSAQAIRVNQIQQAMRTLTNEMEADLAALYKLASRAAGATGTTPFATANNYTAASSARKILVDNGSPESDLQLVIDTTSGVNLRGLQAAVDSAGSSSILRQGVLLDISGMAIRESAQITEPAAGSGANATVNADGYAVGATTLTLSSAGTGAILDGDVVTFAGDSNQYIVKTGDANVAGGGTIVLNEPGLLVAMSTATKAITVVASSPRCMAFHRGAIVLASRLPALPSGGDLAVDRTTVVDPRTGMAFEVAMYPQYRQMQYEVSAAWGVAMIKSAHACNLLG